MSEPPESAEEASEWLRFAGEDLADAKALLEHGSTPRNVCWFALQSVEKAIKAILIFEGTRFPKTHDLDRLLKMTSGPWSAKDHGEDLAWLTGWSPDTRYPGDLEEATHGDARRAVAVAAEILDGVVHDLHELGIKG